MFGPQALAWHECRRLIDRVDGGLVAGTAADGHRASRQRRPHARALFRGPLTQTAQALCAGQVSAAHAGVLAAGPKDLPDHVTVDAERVVTPAQRQALAVRDGGCVFPGCRRPQGWCETHHVRHRLDGGPTDLNNLALLCRAHHRAIHEGGWRLIRGPDGRFTATPADRRHRAAA